MKFLMTYHPGPNAAPPTPETMAAIAKYGEEQTKKGVLLMTGGLVRPSTGIRVRLSGQQFSVLDGPYAETKELIDGFALINAATKEEALEHARSFMQIAGDGESEILAVYDSGSSGPGQR
jgi:hypothetical protein